MPPQPQAGRRAANPQPLRRRLRRDAHTLACGPATAELCAFVHPRVCLSCAHSPACIMHSRHGVCVCVCVSEQCQLSVC